ncbi:urease accessory protein UreD [Streptomyces beihaiensis]|uniref:Urease accessory protein UreD n=1 Tax=Streptomyces beihaiensis TaxID=2984495 RepID=A0ABT3TVH4_9ACTN|nr:urease accessory protein UreD [Streptomyces beihaiensis]MCX3061057.1 urease accessory protein UreD [Streptomyces beihaiensis]
MSTGLARAGVRSVARITARPDGRGGTSLPVLESEGSFAVRRTRAARHGEARVMLVGAMTGPLGGDRCSVEARAEPGARLHIGSVAATLALPGQDKEPAHHDVRLSVGDGARLDWLPEQLISVDGSDLRVTTRVDLAPGAHLVLREEQVLGRAGEGPGRLGSRLTLRRAGRPLLDQELAFGPGAPGGWDGPAVLAGYRALGQLVVVRPGFETDKPAAEVLDGPVTGALTPLAGPAVVVTALAPDALTLRKALDVALHRLA